MKKETKIKLICCILGGFLLYGLTLAQIWVLHMQFPAAGTALLWILGAGIAVFAVLFRSGQLGQAVMRLCGLLLFWFLFILLGAALRVPGSMEETMGMAFGNGEGLMIALFMYTVLISAALSVLAAAFYRILRKKIHKA